MTAYQFNELFNKGIDAVRSRLVSELLELEPDINHLLDLDENIKDDWNMLDEVEREFVVKIFTIGFRRALMESIDTIKMNLRHESSEL